MKSEMGPKSYTFGDSANVLRKHHEKVSVLKSIIGGPLSTWGEPQGVCLLRSILTGFCWGHKPNIEDMWWLWQRRIWLYSFNTLSDNKAFSLHAVTLTLRGLILALNGCEQSDLFKFRQWENCDKQSRLAKASVGGYIESMSVNAFY